MILADMEHPVKSWRDARGWSQSDLAVKAGISFGTVQNIEAGKPVSRRTLRIALEAIGKTLEEYDRIMRDNPAIGAAARARGKRVVLPADVAAQAEDLAGDNGLTIEDYVVRLIKIEAMKPKGSTR